MRHKWVKLRLHVYICRTCGTGKVNTPHAGGWRAHWHTPDGRELVGTLTPDCALGPKTDAYLAKYADAIAAAPEKTPRRQFVEQVAQSFDLEVEDLGIADEWLDDPTPAPTANAESMAAAAFNGLSEPEATT